MATQIHIARLFKRIGLNFATTQAERKLIRQIAERASELASRQGWTYAVADAVKDLTATHCNGTPLRLAELLDNSNGAFGHDVFGIRRFLDHSTGKLTGCFHPRFAAPASKPVAQAVASVTGKRRSA